MNILDANRKLLIRIVINKELFLYYCLQLGFSHIHLHP